MRSLFLLTCITSVLLAQSENVEVIPINQEALKTLIAQREGKSLFLNVWATWCTPCKEEFPDIIKLAQEFQKQNKPIEFIALSADYSDEIEMLIKPFLRTFPEIPFKVYVADFTSQDEFISSLNTDWQGAIPATFLYTTDGKRKKTLIGQHSYEQFKTELDSLLMVH